MEEYDKRWTSLLQMTIVSVMFIWSITAIYSKAEHEVLPCNSCYCKSCIYPIEINIKISLTTMIGMIYYEYLKDL